MEYNVKFTLELIKHLMLFDDKQLMESIGIDAKTYQSIMEGNFDVSNNVLEKIYSYIFDLKINVNELITGIYDEELLDNNHIILYHGSKNGISGSVSPNVGKGCNDFGSGFYCGTSYKQAALFISNHPKSSIYTFDFNLKGLKGYKFDLDVNWMLMVGYRRGYLDKYINSPVLKGILEKAKGYDYYIAPIADNRMFEILNAFLKGEITDEQCLHSLVASELGYQYVLISKKATKALKLINRSYLCDKERKKYISLRNIENKEKEELIAKARIEYRQKGKYVDELL